MAASGEASARRVSIRMNAQVLFDSFNALNAHTITNFQLIDSVVPYQWVVKYLKKEPSGFPRG